MKSKKTAIALCVLLGGMGVHKFYLGERLAGLLYLVFFWTFIPGFISLIDLFRLLSLTDKQFNNRYNYDESEDLEAIERLTSLYLKGVITKEELHRKQAVILKKSA